MSGYFKKKLVIAALVFCVMVSIFAQSHAYADSAAKNAGPNDATVGWLYLCEIMESFFSGPSLAVEHTAKDDRYVLLADIDKDGMDELLLIQYTQFMNYEFDMPDFQVCFLNGYCNYIPGFEAYITDKGYYCFRNEWYEPASHFGDKYVVFDPECDGLAYNFYETKIMGYEDDNYIEYSDDFYLSALDNNGDENYGEREQITGEQFEALKAKYGVDAKETDLLELAKARSDKDMARVRETAAASGAGNGGSANGAVWMKSVTVGPTPVDVYVGGDHYVLDAYLINDYNYFKLRDIAYILSGTENQFNVGWNDYFQYIHITRDEPYTKVGGEIERVGAGEKTCVPNNEAIYIDGHKVINIVYTIDDYNYFKLRDLGRAVDFGVEWSEADDAIIIDAVGGYTP